MSLEGSARKLVAVRSALQLHNALPHPVELRLDRAPAVPSTLSAASVLSAAHIGRSKIIWDFFCFFSSILVFVICVCVVDVQIFF